MDGITDSVGTSLSKLGEIVKDREAWHAAVSPWGRRVGHDLAATTAEGYCLTFSNLEQQ